MRTLASWIGQVANCALFQSAGITLQIFEFDRISRFSAGGDSMGAVMASLAIYTSVPLRESIKVIILFVPGLCVAVITARFVQPRFGVPADFIHAAMAVRAAHLVFSRHHISQALRLRSRVAVVATLGGVGNLAGVFLVDRLRQ